MSPLMQLDQLYDVDRGESVVLPPELAALYGRLQFPARQDRPYVIVNFVSTVDGVVSLDVPGQAGGGPISGPNPHDRMVMGLLRAVADVVIVGAGTLRATPDHIWTAQYIYPTLADSYEALRDSLEKTGPPLNVIVTASGEIDPGCRVFQSGEVRVLIITTEQGLGCMLQHGVPPSVEIVAVPGAGRFTARSILEAVGRACSSEVVLVEGGPHLLGDFFADPCVDELFLTLAPQVAGRDASGKRPGLVEGRVFAPEHPLWGTLVNVKRGRDHLFLRYTFSSGNSEGAGPNMEERPHASDQAHV